MSIRKEIMNIRMSINEKKIENKKRKSIKPKVNFWKRFNKVKKLFVRLR